MRKGGLLSAPMFPRVVLAAALSALAADGAQAQMQERTQIQVVRNKAPRGDGQSPMASPTMPNVTPPAETQSAPSPVSAEPVPETLNIIRTAPDQIGQVPGQFMWVRDGLMAARDTLDNALVFFDDNGRVLGRAMFPAGFGIEDIVGLPDAIRMIDTSYRMQIAISRNIDPATNAALTITPNVSDAAARVQRLTRRSAQELVVNDERRNRPLAVRSLAGGRLAQAQEISIGNSNNRFVATEEIVAVKPALQVRVFVQRFDNASRLTGVAYVPLDNFEDEVPRNFLAVTGGGLLRVLRPTRQGIKIDEYDFKEPPRGNRRLGDAELRSLSRKLREIAVDTTVQGDTSTPFNSGTGLVEVDVATPPISRAKVLENARAFLTVNWVMQRENFSRAGIANRCDPARSYVWLRPRHFTDNMVGTTIGPMPYRWGGDDTPATFRTRIGWGALAGDLCTCRQAAYNYCIFADSAGVDCSGFVSRAWGIEKRGTSGLLDVAVEADSIDALKPGDAFNWPQRHIRLFTGFGQGAAITFTVLESSTRYECEGVCERAYRPSEMNGYRLIRYKGIAENGAVAVNAPNGNVSSVSSNDSAASNGAAIAPPATNSGAETASKASRRAGGAKRRTAITPRRAVRSVFVNDRRRTW